ILHAHAINKLHTLPLHDALPISKELGNVEIIWNAPASADQLKQKEILESFITQRVDGIAISALNGDYLTDTINRAIDSGIPVVRSEEHTSELQSRENLVCRLLLE